MKKLIIAVPVSSKEGLDLVKDFADEVIVLDVMRRFISTQDS